VGSKSSSVDLTKVTASGILCLEELVQITLLDSQAEVPPDWLVITCATCVESHFDRVLRSLIAASGVRQNEFSNSLYEFLHDDIFKTWDSRLNWLKNGFSVTIAGDRTIQDFRTVIDLRNAIVHGQGHLTEMQQKNLQKLLDLKRNLTRLLNVQFSGDKVLIPPDIGLKVVRICRDAVIFLDNSVLQEYPNISV
jgi:hypothetical protein